MEMANKGRQFAKGCAIAVVVFAVVAEVALSCISLCARLHRSSGVKALWYQKLADCGVVFAQYKVAMMYQEGSAEGSREGCGVASEGGEA